LGAAGPTATITPPAPFPSSTPVDRNFVPALFLLVTPSPTPTATEAPNGTLTPMPTVTPPGNP